ncbi:transposase [Streptomyces sp. AcE210]|uniref:transposase n=1 Tax=Streptomyces sp. AcE210 TaxID=2292703 RepID=UPI001F0C9A32|nr:transposase [Streptomyces sp. AcE210]
MRKPGAARWGGSCRREATDRILITGEPHLRHVIDQCTDHHNTHRPHRSLGQRSPAGVGTPEPPAVDDQSRVSRRDRLGRLIHEYTQVAWGDRVFGTHRPVLSSALRRSPTGLPVGLRRRILSPRSACGPPTGPRAPQSPRR